jgi:hypothetical protein
MTTRAAENGNVTIDRSGRANERRAPISQELSACATENGNIAVNGRSWPCDIARANAREVISDAVDNVRKLRGRAAVHALENELDLPVRRNLNAKVRVRRRDRPGVDAERFIRTVRDPDMREQAAIGRAGIAHDAIANPHDDMAGSDRAAL